MHHTRLQKLWDQLASSYWFVPCLITVFAAIAAAAATGLDEQVAWPAGVLAWIDAGQPESARTLLATIASATITIASLTFSITIVALTLASSHFGSRLLYNFMRDRANQFALGTFVGVFVYCLLVLRSIRSSDESGSGFVPHLATTFGMGLAVLSIGVLIFFIHHVAHSIQATSIIAACKKDLNESIERFFPEACNDDDPSHDCAGDAAAPTSLCADPGGVLQAIEVESLLELATDLEGCVHVRRRPGDAVLAGTPLADIRSDGEVTAASLERAGAAFVFGSRRTLIQDVEFAFLQLVEIGVRALSPGINDPFTACACLDELGSGLARVMQRGPMRETRRDEAGQVRVVLRISTFDGMTEAAFNQIRQHGATNVAVVIRILDVLRELSPLAQRPEHLAALRKQADATFSIAMEAEFAELDRGAVRERYEQLDAAFDEARATIDGS